MAVPSTPELKSAMKKADADAPKYFVVRALDKFAPKGKDELAFEKKDLILVLEENAAEGKFRGEVIRGGKVKNEKTGWFPSFYARKDPNEKLPELPPSLQPKKRADTKVEMKDPPPDTSRRSTNPSEKASSPAGSLRHSPAGDGMLAVASEDKPSLLEMRKRFGGSRSTTIRTLKLMNDEAADAEEEEEPDTPDTPEPDPEEAKDKGAYMQGVASKMVSKLAFMQSKKKNPKHTPSAANTGTGGKKSGLFSSLRKSKDTRSSSGVPPEDSKKKAVSAPGSAGGTEKDKQTKSTIPSAAAISERLSKANAEANASSPPLDESVPHIVEPTPSPRGNTSNDPLRQSKSMGDLGEHKSVNFNENSSTSQSRSGSIRSRKGSRAVIVEEDAAPAPQSAAVQQFNPEGKNIEIISEIGKGATGSVWKGCIDGEFVALKQISLMNVKNVKNMRAALKEEVELMKGFNHPNILKYYAMFYSRVNQEINIVLELVEGVSAAKLVTKQKPITEALAAQVIYQLLDAIKFLVRQNIVHRDVKPQNMLINEDGVVKLIDFGTVAKLGATATHRNSTVGTPWYVAPEVITGDDYGYTADVWSVGCTLLEFVTGKPPYHDQNSVAALFKMVDEPHPPVPTNLSKECSDFLLACFKRDHKVRIMAHQCQELPYVATRAPQADLANTVQSMHVVPKDDGGFDL